MLPRHLHRGQLSSQAKVRRAAVLAGQAGPESPDRPAELGRRAEEYGKHPRLAARLSARNLLMPIPDTASTWQALRRRLRVTARNRSTRIPAQGTTPPSRTRRLESLDTRQRWPPPGESRCGCSCRRRCATSPATRRCCGGVCSSTARHRRHRRLNRLSSGSSNLNRGNGQQLSTAAVGQTPTEQPQPPWRESRSRDRPRSGPGQRKRRTGRGLSLSRDLRFVPALLDYQEGPIDGPILYNVRVAATRW